MPSHGLFLLWARNDNALANQYARAMEARADAVFDEMFEIADNGSNDWMERRNADGSTYEALNAEHVQRSRLRVETRKWALARMNARKYGDKTTTEITGKDGGPVQSETKATIDISGLDKAQLEALASIRVPTDTG